MRFLADIGISPKAVAALRHLGHDAVHLFERGLGELPDDAILQKAREESRIVLTHDLDMSREMALGGSDRPSFMTFRLAHMDHASLLPRLLEALRACEQDLAAGAAVTVTDHQIRARRLPILPFHGPA